MPQAPQHEIPRGPVPQPRAEEHDALVHLGAQLALAVASQGNVQVIPEPGGQADVPPPPELLDGGADVGVVEVFQKLEAEHAPQADGHVAVAGEVEVDLQAVAQRPQPGHPDVQLLGGGGKHQVRHAAGGVGQKQLLPQAQHKPAHTVGGELRGGLPVVDLVRHIVVDDDGPGDELGEEGDIQRQLHDAFGAHLPVTVHVDHIGQALEREKGDADRQGDACQGDLQGKDLVHRGEEEVGVLKQGQHPQVEHHRQGQHQLVQALAAQGQQPPGGKIHQDGRQHEQDVHRLAEGVEQQAGDEQQDVLGPDAGQHPGEDEHHGQEDEQEHSRTENHGSKTPLSQDGWGGRKRQPLGRPGGCAWYRTFFTPRPSRSRCRRRSGRCTR